MKKKDLLQESRKVRTPRHGLSGPDRKEPNGYANNVTLLSKLVLMMCKVVINRRTLLMITLKAKQAVIHFYF